MFLYHSAEEKSAIFTSEYAGDMVRIYFPDCYESASFCCQTDTRAPTRLATRIAR